jgi:hypothetical protein
MNCRFNNSSGVFTMDSSALLRSQPYNGSKGSEKDCVSVFLAIASFWRPGNAGNAGLRRSAGPSVDADSGDKRKD